MNHFSHRSTPVLTLLGSVLLLSCSPEGPTQPGATAGRIVVSVAASGSGIPTSFSATVDGRSASVAPGGSVAFDDVAPGNYSVQLNVPANCMVTGTNPRAVGVQEASTSTVSFAATCSTVPTGAIGVTTTTGGDAIDPDGYVVSVDGGSSTPIAVNGTALIADLPAGTRSVELAGVADNCLVQGNNPRSLVVTENQTTQTSFSVVCSSTTGLIDVSVTTTGPEPDPDGYDVNLDGVATQTLAVNGSTTFTGVEEGAHVITLENVAPNCSVAETNPAGVDVTAGQTTEVTFTVTCAATTGSVTVSASTSGSELDPNGYSASVDGGPEQPLAVNGSVQFAGLSPGSHDVELTGVAANCSVTGSNPRSVTVVAGQAASTNFAVTCSSTVGAIEVNVTTSGPNPDPDGYSVSLDGGSPVVLTTNGSTTYSGVAPGSHSLLLANVAANCTVSGSNPRNASVSAGATTVVNFAVTCSALTGSVRVTMSTSGSELDPDGYTLTLDGSGAQAVGINGTRTFSGVVIGDHDVEVTGVADNCAVQGDNPRSVTVTNGATTQVDIDVVCSATTGLIEVTVSTTGDELDPDGYSVSLDGTSLRAIATNGSTTFTGVGPGSHSLELLNVAANCAVTPPNPKSTNVTAGATSNVAFAVTCTRTTGDIRVTANSSGSPSDPNGYTVTVDGTNAMSLPINGDVLFADLTAGNHTIEISDVAATCTVSGSTSRDVAVTADAESGVTFNVTCAPLTGSIQVDVSTGGADLDPDGYSITLDGGSAQAVATNGSTTFNDVVTGNHTLQLNGNAANCTVTSPNPTATTVVANTTANVAFTVDCTATTGDLRVTASSSGSPPDADGYTVSVDGGAAQALAVNGDTLTFSGLSAGPHSVTLGGVAANCTVADGATHNPVVSAGGTTVEVFEVTCAPTTGSIRVDVATTGSDLDSDGYTVRVDAGTPAPIGVNDTTTFNGVTPGDRDVTLEGLAANCSVTSGANPETVTVTAGATATVSFSVNCSPTTGDLLVTATSTGLSSDPDGYMVSVDGGSALPLAINGDTLSFTGLLPGAHSVELSDVLGTCTVAGGTTHNPVVVAGAATVENFAVSCP